MALSGIVLYGKKQRIAFNKLNFIKSKKLSAEGEFTVNQTKVSVGFLIADEFGSVTSDVLAQAAKEAHKLHKDALFALAFNFDPVETEFLQSLPLPVYPVKISPDMHASNELNNSQSSVCFVLYGCPVLDLQQISRTEFQLELKGVRMYNPLAQIEELQPPESVGAWFIDSNYNGREFSVCQARYPDASLNPYRRWNSRADAARLDRKEWDALTSSVSDVIGNSKRIAVKIVSPAGDENTIIVPVPSSRPSSN